MSIFPLTFIFIAAIANFGQLQDPAFEPGLTELRAFVYRMEGADSWIASDEPALKSCCRGALAKLDRQVLLEIDLSQRTAFESLDDGSAVLISGELEKADSARSWPRWVLKKARLESKDHNQTTQAALIALICTFVVLIILGWTWKKGSLSDS